MNSLNKIAIGVVVASFTMSSAFAIDNQVSSHTSQSLVIDNGEVFAMGYSSNKSLTGSQAEKYQLVPLAVGIVDAKSVHTTSINSAILTNSGEVYLWGFDWETRTTIPDPILVEGLTNVTDMALTTNGALFIDNGTLTGYNYVDTFTYDGFDNITTIDAEGDFALFIDSNGSAWSFGNSNTYGQLGTGDTVAYLEPVQLSGLSNIVDIAAGTKHGVALDDQGNVYTWGDASYGKTGHADQELLPKLVEGLTNIVNVEAGANKTIALDSNGLVHVLGSHNLIGDDIYGNSVYNYTRTGFSTFDFGNVADINVGRDTSFIRLSDNSFYGWGGNSGRLGDGTTTESHYPVEMLAGEYPIAYSIINPLPEVVNPEIDVCINDNPGQGKKDICGDGNNGHGNDEDGFDESNPGKSKGNSKKHK